MLVDFVTESTRTRQVIGPLQGGLLGAPVLSPDGTALTWQEWVQPMNSEPFAVSYLSQIERGRLSHSLELEGKTPQFSPSGRRLVAEKPLGDSAIELIFLDLAHGAPSEALRVELPLSWAQIRWSRDESHLSIIGGNPQSSRRELYVIDLWDEAPQPVLLEFCPPSTEANPRCPNWVVF